MRILDLGEFHSERGGGVRSYANGLMEAAAVRGHEVILVAPGPNDSDESVRGGRVLRYRAPRMPYDGTYHFPWRLGLMRRWVESLRPDVLQISSPYLPWVAARQLRVPVRSYIYHSDPIGAYVTPFTERLPWPLRGAALDVAWRWMRSVCNSCDVTVVAGEWLRAELRQHGVERVRAVPFGIAHQNFEPSRRSSSVRSRWASGDAEDDGTPLLLIAGRLAIEKRQALLVRAVARLNETRPVALLILGDGPESQRLRRLAERLLPQTRFLPFTRDAAEYSELLASADALVHGSCCETYGFVLVEALASGTPLVVPDRGGAAHLASDDSHAKYAPDASEADIAQAIASLLDRPRERTRHAALEASRRHPSRQQHYDGLFALYDELLARGRARAKTPD
ncbi:MAG TPA: glycosyltransferase [Polyangiaceae bacterium]|nr:glycosyltransferase [Polyangiaceae bacterium]